MTVRLTVWRARRFELVADELQAVKSVLALADVPGAIRLAHEDLQPLEERLSKQAEESDSLVELVRGYAAEYDEVREENPSGPGRLRRAPRWGPRMTEQRASGGAGDR